MTKANDPVSRINIKLDGAPVERAVMQKLLEVVVDQHAHLPDMFTIRCHDTGLELLDEGPFDLTKAVDIEATKKNGDKVRLMKGEITALEPSFDEGMVAELLVRGYDLSHRLYRETKSQAHLNKKDSDLAEEIAGVARLRAEVEPTPTVYEHLFQHNQSDLAFLTQRAWRIGYECFVDDGALYFRPPPPADAGVTLTWGDDLLTFRPRMTLAEQVDEVVVKGWDVEKQTAIVGRAQNGRLYPQVEEKKDGAGWASAFGAGKMVIVDQPVVSQAEADALAAARLDELSGAFVQAEGTAFRRPDIKAGRAVKLEGLGKRFSGSYLVTSASHVHTHAGLVTTFHVRGTRTGSLTEQMSRGRPLDRWPGVVSAVVTNTDDPQKWGRVKVKFPWMTDEAESDWARVVGAGAGPGAGLFATPEVGDEVLVAFAHGDFGQPYVLGGLWNGLSPSPSETSESDSGERPLVRTWRSRTGHCITMYDNAENKLEIHTAGGHQFTLDDADQTITLKSTGSIKLNAQDDIDIHTAGEVNITGAIINLN